MAIIRCDKCRRVLPPGEESPCKPCIKLALLSTKAQETQEVEDKETAKAKRAAKLAANTIKAAKPSKVVTYPDAEPPKPDTINPDHYKSHPSGVECIQITEHFNFNIGNAIKYLWRVGLKHDDWEEELNKVIWYVQREIAKRKQEENNNDCK